MDTQDTPTYLTPRQVARLLRVDATTVRKRIKQGILEAEVIRVGKRHRYRIAQQTIGLLVRN